VSATSPSPDVIVVGAGLAGAATAFFLSRERSLRIVLLEQEPELAAHSSGRNAGLVRRACGDPALDPLCDEGAAFYAAPPDDLPVDPRFRRTGSFLLVTPEQAKRWARAGVVAATHAELRRAVPPFEPEPRSAVLHSADDGVVEPRSVVEGFLAGARRRGVELRVNDRATRLHVERGRVAGVAAARGRLAAACVVDAAGAWAGELAATAGAGDGQLTPLRRHLLVTEPDLRVDPSWPWVWDTLRGFYFRPETGGLLLCACDEGPDRPGPCAVDPVIAAQISRKVERCLPSFADLRPRRLWAGHRTRRPDGRFLLGADPRVGGLVWAAGLGGHGVTTAPAVGRRVAEAVVALLAAGR